jgi:antitoxin component YwqK of YwqJK toxin-antitoxin module
MGKDFKQIKDDEGNIIEECQYLNDLRHGKRVLFGKNGIKLGEANYLEGKLNGKSLEWYENGAKAVEAGFKDDK